MEEVCSDCVKILSLSLSRLAFILIFSLVLVSCGGGGGGGSSSNNDDVIGESGTVIGLVDTNSDGISDGTAIDINGDGEPDGLDIDGDLQIDKEWDKTYSVMSDAQAVSGAAYDLNVAFGGSDTETGVTQHLTLPVNGENGTTITWSSSNTSIIAADGTVMRPAYGSGSATVALTATIIKNGVSETKVFIITVLESPQTDEQKVAADTSALAIVFAAGDSMDNVTKNIGLPAVGSCGTTITWTSDNTTVIAINGTVSRPTYNDGEAATVTVTLTATISKNGENDTKTFTLTVKKISTSATLSGLTVSKGILQPTFNSSITTYLDAPVPFSDSATPAYNDTQSASITATATNSAATITINSNTVSSGSAYTMNNLAVGANTATIVVTAEDGVTTATYTVTVYRAVPVFKIGQTTSYATGDDGDLEKGVSWPATRFTDNGNGTMTDNMTGLVWLKDTSQSIYTWTSAITYCEGVITGGSDWRMPNQRELKSLLHYGQGDVSTWLNGQGFPYVINGAYYSSTTYGKDTSRAWYVFMVSGLLRHSAKTASRYAWPVQGESVNIPATGQIVELITDDDGAYRRGIKLPAIRFLDNGDGTITDNMTGLMWLQNANNVPGTKTWSDALAYITGLNNGTNSGNCGHSDWRLSSMNEFETLIDYGQNDISIWLSGQGFTNLQSGYYWTGTTYASDNTSAWPVSIDSGESIYQNKTSLYYVWPVRGPVK